MNQTLRRVVLLSTMVVVGPRLASAVPVMPAAPNDGWLFDENYGVLGTTITDNFGALNGKTQGTTMGTDSSTGGPQSSSVVPFAYTGNGSFSTLNGPDATSGTGATRWHGEFTEGSWRNLMNGASAVTVQAWVNYPSNKLNPTSGGNLILSGQISAGNAGLWINIDGTNNKVVVGGRSQPSDGFQSLATTAALTPGQWNHIVAVLDFASDQIRVAINGGAFQTADVSFGLSAFDPTGGALGTPDFISGRTPAARYIGLMDEVAIWKTALSQDNVEWLKDNSLTSIPEPGAIFLAMMGCAMLFSARRVCRKK